MIPPDKQRDSERQQVTRRRVLASSTALVAGHTIGVNPASGANSLERSSVTPSVSPRKPGSSVQHDVSLDGIETFIDQQMDETVGNGAVVGATASVVRGDETVLANGYGETHVDDGDAVDGETLFRVGSLSKPIVWTAAMQLIDSGQIDPNEDIETYLDAVSIVDTYDDPITMAHLATHTAGFEPRNQGVWVSDPDDVRSLPDVLDDEQPTRVRPPGELVSYSNYGAALAGQVIADVASQSLADYIQTNIFEPLRMTTATFEQPRPNEGAAGYTAALGTPTPVPDRHIEIWPAGSLTASATDMSRFMRATLAGGGLDGEQALSADGVERMHDQWFTHHPALDGLGFGWIEDTRGDVRTLWHNGSIPGSFYSHLLLVPDADIGLFLAYNTDAGASAATDFIDEFVTEYLSPEQPSRLEPSGQPDRADDLEGSYRGLRVSETTHSRLFTTLQAGDVTVSVNDDGYLVTEAGGGPTRWVEREPLVFDRAEGDETLAFDSMGNDVSNLYVGWQAFSRQSWHESLSLHGALGAGSALGMLSGVVGWPALRGWRRFRESDEQAADASDQVDTDGSSEGEASAEAVVADVREGDMADKQREAASDSSSRDGLGSNSTPGSRDHGSGSGTLFETVVSPRVARWTIGGSALTIIAFVLGAGAGLVFDPNLLSDPPLWYRLLLLLPVLATIGTVVSIVSAILAWRDDEWTRRALLHFGIVTVATGIACWQLFYWNLYGMAN